MATNLALVTSGLTVGAQAVPYVVGSAAIEFRPNPVLAQILDIVGSQAATSAPGREMDSKVFAHVSPYGPQTIRDFVKLFAIPHGEKSIADFFGAAGPFEALQSKWDEQGLKSATSRMAHGLWTYSSFSNLARTTDESLGHFEAENPGRGAGTILNELARATHNAWLDGEKQGKGKEWWFSYDQRVHDFITWGIEAGFIDVPIGVHTNPRKKFKLTDDSFTASTPEERVRLVNAFHDATGVNMYKPTGFEWYINTVAGER